MKKYVLNSILIASYVATAYAAAKLISSMKRCNYAISYIDLRTIREDTNQIADFSKLREQ